MSNDFNDILDEYEEHIKNQRDNAVSVSKGRDAHTVSEYYYRHLKYLDAMREWYKNR